MDNLKNNLKKILVVDDEGDVLKMARIRLEANGYQVIVLENGEEALAVARSQKPDLILLDIVMPGKSGTDVCKELKGDPDTLSIPVVIFTAQYQEAEYVKIISGLIGADDYILKPFEAALLLAKIKFLIK